MGKTKPSVQEQTRKIVSNTTPAEELENYFFIVFCTRKMVSAVRTGIASSVSAYLIKFLMISRSSLPVSSVEQSIPRSLHFNDIIGNHLFFVNPPFPYDIIKAGEAPVHGTGVMQSNEKQVAALFLRRKV
ncbi:MAG TPA: hypothetical protein VLL74_07925 [Methanoregula sp.]|nr:hypothetical protein [Methanoregula sp.]